MNITDYVHGRCTVERVTIKTSLKVNGGEGGEGKRGEEGLQDSHWLCIPPLPKEQTWIIKLLLTELFEALSPPQKKDSNKLIWSEPFTAFSNWFNSNRNRNNYCVCGAKCAVYLLPICILPQLELIPHTTNKNTTNNYVSFNIMQQRIQAIEQLSSLHLINLFGRSLLSLFTISISHFIGFSESNFYNPLHS